MSHETWQPASVEWYTPPHVFEALGLTFDLDPCSPMAGPVPHVPAAAHYTRADDGLACPWFGRVWCNPPYGDQVGRFVGRLAEHGDGVALVASRTDTRWFHSVAPRAALVCFVKGRLDLLPGPGSSSSRPAYPSVLLAFGDVCAEALERSGLGLTGSLAAGVGDRQAAMV